MKQIETNSCASLQSWWLLKRLSLCSRRLKLRKIIVWQMIFARNLYFAWVRIVHIATFFACAKNLKGVEPHIPALTGWQLFSPSNYTCAYARKYISIFPFIFPRVGTHVFYSHFKVSTCQGRFFCLSRFSFNNRAQRTSSSNPPANICRDSIWVRASSSINSGSRIRSTRW